MSIIKMTYARNNFSLSKITSQQFKSIFYSFFVASLIAMGSVYARSNQSVASIDSSAESCICIRAVVGIYVNGKIYLCFLCCFNQPRYHIVMVWSPTVFGANGYLALCTFQSISYTSHVNGEKFSHISRNRGAAAVTYFFKYGDMVIDTALRDNILLLQIFGIAQKNSGAQLVIQKAAFDKSRRCYYSSWVKANDIAGHDTQIFYVFSGSDYFIQQYFHIFVAAFRFAVLAVNMNGSIT